MPDVIQRVAASTWVIALIALSSSSTAYSAYPDRPVRLLLGFAPGGGADINARHFATKMSEVWHQQVVVDNRPGAGGTLAAEIAARAPADGYTLFQCGSASMNLGPLLYRKLRYEPFRDFVPVTPISAAPNVLVVHPSLPVRTVSDIIAYAKANPGKLAYGSAGVGSTLHLSMELFKSMSGTHIVHVPYKGGAPALTDLLAGQVQVMCDNIQAQLPMIRSNRVRPLGVSWAKRTSLLPDVPTIAESGLPGFEAGPWYGLCALAGTPQPILDQLHADAMKAINSPDMRARFLDQGLEPKPMTPAQFGEFMRTETVRWSRVIKSAGIQPE